MVSRGGVETFEGKRLETSGETEQEKSREIDLAWMAER